VKVRAGDPAGAATQVVVVAEGADAPLPGAKAKPGKVASEGGRIAVGIGAGAPEDVRIAAAAAVGRAKDLGTESIGYDGPHPDAFAEGAVLAAYEFTAFKADPEPASALAELVVREGEQAAVVAECVNLARDLQNTPANHMTPTELARRAQAIEGVECEVWGRAEIEAAGMGAFAGVAQGSAEEPALITLRYDGGGDGPTLGLVGKAVTFDAGGISIKPAMKMSEMKFDMSGGAAVLGATAAIARLGLPVKLVSVIGSCENLVDGRSMKPGDILRSRAGVTIEVINTDAEGRLVLADCLTHAIEQGAERLIDIATLTGGIVTTFGTGHAGLMGTDDGFCDAVRDAGELTGERVWRLPLDPHYDEMIKSPYADIVNAVENRRAHSITAAQFLARFTAGVPWAHVDMAGVANDNGRPYTAQGGSGWGVRLLVEVARMAGQWTSTSLPTTS
jgi:leucyl aminopeptidase